MKEIMNIDSIFKAASKNDHDVLKKAIDDGLNPNLTHPKGGTLLLQIAARANAIEAMKVLLDGGADPSLATTRTSPVDGRVFENHVALMYAGSVEAARMLVEAGAKIEAKDEKQWTPLTYAAHAGDVDRFNYLLGCGADPSVLIWYDQRMLPIREMVEIRIGDLVAAVEQNGRNDLLPELERLRVIQEILLKME